MWVRRWRLARWEAPSEGEGGNVGRPRRRPAPRKEAAAAPAPAAAAAAVAAAAAAALATGRRRRRRDWPAGAGGAPAGRQPNLEPGGEKIGSRREFRSAAARRWPSGLCPAPPQSRSNRWHEASSPALGRQALAPPPRSTAAVWKAGCAPSCAQGVLVGTPRQGVLAGTPQGVLVGKRREVPAATFFPPVCGGWTNPTRRRFRRLFRFLEEVILWFAFVSENWCNAVHAGVFSDGRPSVHGVAPSPTAPASSRVVLGSDPIRVKTPLQVQLVKRDFLLVNWNHSRTGDTLYSLPSPQRVSVRRLFSAVWGSPVRRF